MAAISSRSRFAQQPVNRAASGIVAVICLLLLRFVCDRTGDDLQQFRQSALRNTCFPFIFLLQNQKSATAATCCPFAPFLFILFCCHLQPAVSLALQHQTTNQSCRKPWDFLQQQISSPISSVCVSTPTHNWTPLIFFGLSATRSWFPSPLFLLSFAHPNSRPEISLISFPFFLKRSLGFFYLDFLLYSGQTKPILTWTLPDPAFQTQKQKLIVVDTAPDGKTHVPAVLTSSSALATWRENSPLFSLLFFLFFFFSCFCNHSRLRTTAGPILETDHGRERKKSRAFSTF